MSDGIKLDIHDRKTGDRRIENTGLPVEIGKSPSGANGIVLGDDRPTVSRRHGRIERRGAELRYIDTSSNGTTIDGQLIKGGERTIEAGELIFIEDYAIQIVGQETVSLKCTDAQLAPLADLRIATDESCLVCQDGETFTLKKKVADQDGADVVLEMSFDGAVFLVESRSDENAPEVRLNNRSVNLPARANLGDVVTIGANRIELLGGGQQKIVCGNPECHLLNDLPFEENCVWCGYYLAASGSFTRVTPA